MAEGFFTLVNKQSRFWLPAVLNEIARIPPSLCRGDGCSIFLVHGEDGQRRLHLAATTRRERFSDLFEPRISYSVNVQELTEAAEMYERYGLRVPGASLSGWVAAFNCPLNIKDLQKEEELRAAGTDGRPRPVWSEKSRGPQDDNVNASRPFLCVPMRAGSDGPTGSVVGVIRISTTGLRSVPFEESTQASLQEFADALANFLVECGALTSKELSYAFSIWSASDAAELADRITKAVPRLFDVECCSCFLRDPLGRFVLRKSNPRATSETFQKFVDGNVDKLFYKAGDGSKTAVCIDTQLPIVLVRENQRWALESSEGLGITSQLLASESGGRYIDDGPRPDVTCEFPHDLTQSILLVPVRDHLSAHLPAGVLRVVTTQRIPDSSKIVTDLLKFAEDLAGVIGLARRDDQQRRSRDELVTALTLTRLTTDEKIAAAARIVCDAVDAGAVTIFVRDRRQEKPSFTAKPSYSVLAERYKRPDRESYLEHHARFAEQLRQDPKLGEGRTTWVAKDKKRRVLNLKNIHDANELGGYGLSLLPGSRCELANAGPFLAVPIKSSNDDRVDGIIRALRRRGSEHGSFLLAHEEIMEACANLLATLFATLRWKAVLSFSTDSEESGQATAFSVVKGWVEQHGGEVLALQNRAAEDPMSRFQELCKQADVGIVIATADSSNVVSDWVQAENRIMWCDEHLKSRRIILQMKDVKFRMSDTVEKATVITYSRAAEGIKGKHDEFHDALVSFGLA